MAAAYLRKVKQGRWLDQPDWLDHHDAQADCLADLRTADNVLSFFRIEAADDIPSIDRVTTALAANGERVETLDYVLVDAGIVEELGLRVRASEGNTPDPDVNLRHVDIIDLSSMGLGRLAGRMRHGAFGRVQRSVLERRISDALTTGHCRQELLQGKLRDELRQKKLV